MTLHLNGWGADGRYYSRRPEDRRPTPLSDDESRWAALLEIAAPGTRDAVARTFKQWNNIIRDHLRTETGLRLSVGDEARAVPVRIMDGMPRKLAEAFKMSDDLAWLVMHRPEVDAAVRGTAFMKQTLEMNWGGIPPLVSIEAVRQVRIQAEAWLQEVDMNEAKQRLVAVEEDVLGAYFFRVPEVQIYWLPIGIIARLLDVSVESLTIVVLGHELAHAYTHLGRDIDGELWDTEAMARAELAIVEGLAQFYTKVTCHRLEPRVPEARLAFERLLECQSSAYRAHEGWVGNHERGGEIIRVSMIECRTRMIQEVDAFGAAVARHRRGVRGRETKTPQTTTRPTALS